MYKKLLKTVNIALKDIIVLASYIFIIKNTKKP